MKPVIFYRNHGLHSRTQCANACVDAICQRYNDHCAAKSLKRNVFNVCTCLLKVTKEVCPMAASGPAAMDRWTVETILPKLRAAHAPTVSCSDFM